MNQLAATVANWVAGIHVDRKIPWTTPTLDGGAARALALDPVSAEGRAQAQQHKGGGVVDIGSSEPGRIIGEQGIDGAVEGAPAVDRADTDVNEHGSDGDEPSAGNSGGGARRLSFGGGHAS